VSTFTIQPSYSANQSQEPRIKVAQFGEGYSQRAGDGINLRVREWSLTFNGNAAEMNAVEAFLENENGITAFDWQPPTGSAGKFICMAWNRSIADFNNETVTAVFKEVFGS
jgi:phage-related protein